MIIYSKDFFYYKTSSFVTLVLGIGMDGRYDGLSDVEEVVGAVM